MMSDGGPDQSDKIATTIRQLCTDRGPEKSVCPSEVARAINPDDWRPLMPVVRSVAQNLAEQGVIVITQSGEPVDLATVKGPIRLRIIDHSQ